MNEHIQIAIDGPAAAGKSTIAQLVAYELSYVYIDTGAMYRAITLKALHNHIDTNNAIDLYDLLKDTQITFTVKDGQQHVLLDGLDVTEQVRTQEVTEHVSIVAQHAKLREEMVIRQQRLTDNHHTVMDGRDIGSHVLPHANIKVFLIASVEERAIRRYNELKQTDNDVDLETIKTELKSRDKMDREREVSPLIKANDAIEIDTTALSIDEVKQEILDIHEQIVNKK